MRLLLDTHIYLWCINDDLLLSKEARKYIRDASEVYISTASLWEAAIKIKLKKLNANIDELINAISESGFVELPILTKDIAGLHYLPELHKDPFDRMLLSQAINEPLKLLTCDAILAQYSELVVLV